MKHYKMLKLFLLPTIAAGNILCSCNFDKQKFKDDFSEIVDEMNTKDPAGMRSGSTLEDIVIEVGNGEKDEEKESNPKPGQEPEPEPEPEDEKLAVTFVMHGVEVIYKFAEGEEIVYPEPEVIEHYHFVEWDQEIRFMPNEPLRIVAIYEINKNKLTFDLGYGDIEEYDVEYGAPITYPDAPTNEDNVFIGWDKDISVMPDEPLTITAKWRERIKGKLAYINDQGEEVNLTWEQMIEEEIITTEIKNGKETLCSLDTSNLDVNDGVFIIKESIEYIDNLSSCTTNGIKKIVIPDTVNSLSANAFSNFLDLEEVVLGSGITELSSCCFKDSPNLKTINIDNITRINDQAFWNTSLETLTLSSKVEYVGSYAFRECLQLTEVTIDANNFYNSIFYNCTNLRKVNAGPNFTTTSSEMFKNCYQLELDFIDHLVTFKSNAFTVDSNTYPTYICEHFVIPASAQYFNGDCFGTDSTSVPIYVNQDEKFLYNNTYTSYSSTAFARASATYFLDPNGDVEFNGNTYSILTAIKVPRNVSKIGRYLYTGLKSVTDIYIPKEVTAIGGEIFKWRADGSINVHYEGTQEEWDALQKTEKVGRNTLSNSALNTTNIEFNAVLDY